MSSEDEERRRNSLTREDLTTLLEAYRNMIETNLLLNEKQDEVLKKVLLVIKNFDDLKQILIDSLKTINAHHNDCAKQQKIYNDTIQNKLQEEHDTNLKSNLKHTVKDLKVYALVGLLCTIILSLIALVHKIWPVIKI